MTNAVPNSSGLKICLTGALVDEHPQAERSQREQHAHTAKIPELVDHCFFSFRLPALGHAAGHRHDQNGKGIKASSTGTSMACKSAHRSITPQPPNK